MDTLISSALQSQQQQTAMQVQMSVLQKSMSVQKEVGEMIVGLIDGASMQTPGKAVDAGANFDIYA